MFKLKWLFAIAIVGCCNLALGDVNAAAKFEAKIEGTINSFDPNINVGYSLVRLSDSAVLAANNQDRYYFPASVNKLFTAAAALTTLGHEYQFKTQLWLEDVADLNVNKKNIYIKFAGSPELTIDDLSLMLLQLKLEYPNLVINKVLIEEDEAMLESLPPGFWVEDLDFCYASPVSSIAINKNSTKFKVIPAKVEGGVASVVEENAKFFSNVKSKIITTKHCDKTGELYKNFMGDTYVLSGKMHKDAQPKSMCLTIKDITKHAMLVIENILRLHNLPYTGKVMVGKIPASAYLFTEHLSRNLIDILTDGIKSSDNFLMNAIFLQLTLKDKPKTWFEAGDMVADILYKKYNLPVNSLNLEDGAGIGRNFVTPRTIVTFLQQVYNANDFENFAKVFPLGATDGTLTNRLANINKNVRVIAKTGKCSYVVSLAGYLQINKETYAFAVMVNGRVKPIKYYQDMVDKIIEIMVSEIGVV